MGGRRILDADLVANECIDARVRAAAHGVVCQLDVEKAYDHVHWGFLMYIMERLGFGQKSR